MQAGQARRPERRDTQTGAVKEGETAGERAAERKAEWARNRRNYVWRGFKENNCAKKQEGRASGREQKDARNPKRAETQGEEPTHGERGRVQEEKKRNRGGK